MTCTGHTMEEDEFNNLEPCELFVMTSGDSMQFSIKICPEKIMLQKIIEKCGGQLHAKAGGPNTIRLLPIGDRPTQDEVFASKFIYDCVRSQELCDLNKYRVNAKSLYTDDVDVMEILLGNFTWADCTRSGLKHTDIVSDISDDDDFSSPSRKPKLKTGRREYTNAERKAIVNYIIKNRRYTEVKAKNLWTEMEAANICPGRTWHSLKEHFRNNIVHNLTKMDLPDKEIKKLSYKFTDEHLRENLATASSLENNNLSPIKKVNNSPRKIAHNKENDREDLDNLELPATNKESRGNSSKSNDKKSKQKINQDEENGNDKSIDINVENFANSPKKKVLNASDENSGHNQSSNIQENVEEMQELLNNIPLPDVSKTMANTGVSQDIIGDGSIFYTCQGEELNNVSKRSSSEYEEIPNSESENEINPTEYYLSALNKIDSDTETVPFVSELENEIVISPKRKKKITPKKSKVEKNNSPVSFKKRRVDAQTSDVSPIIDSTESQNVSKEIEYQNVRSPRIRAQELINELGSPRIIPNADGGSSSESEVEVKRHLQNRRRSGLTPRKSTIARNSSNNENPNNVSRNREKEKSSEKNSPLVERNSENEENNPKKIMKIVKRLKKKTTLQTPAILSSSEETEDNENSEELALFPWEGDGHNSDEDDDEDNDDEPDHNEREVVANVSETGVTNASHNLDSETDYGGDTESEDIEDNKKASKEGTKLIKSSEHNESQVNKTNVTNISNYEISYSEDEDEGETEDEDKKKSEMANTKDKKMVKSPSSTSKFNRQVKSPNYDNATGHYDRTYNPKGAKRKKQSAESPKKRRKRESMHGFYTAHEDIDILEYIYEHDGFQEVRGNNLWIVMEKSGVIPGRSWLSLKERFRMRILRRLDSYLEHGLDQDVYNKFNEFKKVKEENLNEDEEIKPLRDKKYTHKDDVKIMRYIEEKNAYDMVGGRKIWQDMVESDILYGRSWLSLKERYRRVIIRNLNVYSAHGFSADQLELFKRPEGDPDQTLKKPRGAHTPYVHKEDQDILNFIIKCKGYGEVAGKNLWLKMSITEELKGRTWLSLKERFRKRIILNLNNFDITEEEKKFITNKTRMNPGKKSPRRIPKGPGYKTSRMNPEPQPSTSGYRPARKQTDIIDSSDEFVDSDKEISNNSNSGSRNKRNKFFKMFNHPNSPHLLIDTPTANDKQPKSRNKSFTGAKNKINKGRLKNNLDQSPTVVKETSPMANSPHSPKSISSTDSKVSKKDESEVMNNLECFPLAADRPVSPVSSTISNMINDLPDLSLDIENMSELEDDKAGEMENLDHSAPVENSNENGDLLNQAQDNDRSEIGVKILQEESESNSSTKIDESEMGIYNLRNSPRKSPRKSPQKSPKKPPQISPRKSNSQLLKSPRECMKLSNNTEIINEKTINESKESETLPNVREKLTRNGVNDLEEINQKQIYGEKEVSSSDESNKENKTNSQEVNLAPEKSIVGNNESTEMVESETENNHVRRSGRKSKFNLLDASPRKKPKETKSIEITKENSLKAEESVANLNCSEIDIEITSETEPKSIDEFSDNEANISIQTKQMPSNMGKPSPQKFKALIINHSPRKSPRNSTKVDNTGLLNLSPKNSPKNNKTPSKIVTPIRKVTNKQLNSMKKKILIKSNSPRRALKGLENSQIVCNKLRKRPRSKTK